MLHSFTFGVFHPAAIAFIATNVPPEKRAVGMTVYMSLGTGFPTFLGNIAGGIIIEYAGYRMLFGSFIIFALLALFLYAVCKDAVCKDAVCKDAVCKDAVSGTARC
jgi:PPP family 3-phenylpropionic acid transporter